MKRLLKFLCMVCLMTATALPAHAANLPAGYTELEYIKATGTQYIDTGIVMTNDVEFTARVGTTTTNVLGITEGTSGLVVWQSNRMFDFRYYPTDNPGRDYTDKTTIPFVSNQLYDVGFNINKNSFVVDGTSVPKTKTIKNVGLQIRTGLRDITAALKIWDDGTLVRDFVPAKRKSDGTVGMYDMVSGQFFTNVGTGDFVAGPSVNKIKIATTKYTEDAFAGLMTTLSEAITKVTNIVDTTVQQATEIGNLATTKQDRPDTDCPAGRKCLLIMGADNKPHWYLIQE